MSTLASKPLLTPEEYLVIEDAAEFKSEFYDGEMFAMSGGGYDHSIIATNLTAQLHARLRGGPCRPLNNDLRVQVPATEFYTYPDVSVLCGAPRFAAQSRTTIANPTLIVEVLSPSTERYDRTAKFWHYQKLATLQDYVLVTQDAPQVERFSRQGEQWVYAAYKGLESGLPLPALSIEIPLKEIYEGVAFLSPEPLADEKLKHPRPPIS